MSNKEEYQFEVSQQVVWGYCLGDGFTALKILEDDQTHTAYLTGKKDGKDVRVGVFCESRWSDPDAVPIKLCQVAEQFLGITIDHDNDGAKVTKLSNDFGSLVGEIVESVKNDNDETLTIVTKSGLKYVLEHHQDCCESVRIESIVGDLQSMVGQRIEMAEESSRGAVGDEASESGTWTFYKLATIKGYIDIRWLGESNGYYSEGVSLTVTGSTTIDWNQILDK